MGKNQHVVPSKSGGWNVKGAGNSKQPNTSTQSKLQSITEDKLVAIKKVN